MKVGALYKCNSSITIFFKNDRRWTNMNGTEVFLYLGYKKFLYNNKVSGQIFCYDFGKHRNGVNMISGSVEKLGYFFDEVR